ncbi:Uncharacterised protein [Mycobacteroides abscessus subsp. abscessus]|nr:Uncharacterised protein [Mycobacteroides abscessus subsp. abscessus]
MADLVPLAELVVLVELAVAGAAVASSGTQPCPDWAHRSAVRGQVPSCGEHNCG